jgi:hypothetical protein
VSDTQHPKAHITFEGPQVGKTAPTVTITGIAADQLKHPDKIMKLMDFLELPKGTNARIIYSADDVIVR